MVSYLHIGAIILAGLAVAVADALIKKTAVSGSFSSAIKNPLMFFILLLYLAQVLFFIYVFIHKWDLGIVGNLQMVFYSLGVIIIGVLGFGETLSSTQIAGIVLALIGATLMNL